MADSIMNIEVFEDRAAVTRATTVEAGRHTLRFGPVSPLVAAERLTTPREHGDADWTVEDVRLVTEHLREAEADSALVARLRAEVRRLNAERRRVRATEERLREQADRLMGVLSAAESGLPAAVQAEEASDEWVDGLRSLAVRAAEARRRALEANQESKRLGDERALVKANLKAAENPDSVRRTFIELQVIARTLGTVRVRTVIPCALWRPVHRATLRQSESGPQVDWVVRAAIWNRTGIDWDGVPVVCSTERPGQPAEPPVLHDDFVQVVRRGSEVVVEAREESVQLAREGGVKTTSVLPGVDDGGEVRVYEVPDPVHLACDGHPVFVDLEGFSASCEKIWRCVPSVAPEAVLQTRLTNPTRRPLLAGPVELIRESEAVGRTSIGLVPPAEPFSIGWGSHDGVRVVRSETHDREVSTFTGTQTHTFDVRVRISHLSAEPLQLRIDERIPVSELKQVSIEVGDSTPALSRRPDQDGLCGWNLELGPYERRELELAYVVTASSKVRLPF